MPLNRRPLRYAHTTGYTDVCCTKDGKHVLTCGRDGDIRIWLGVEDDDPNSLCGGDYVQCVRVDQENKIYLANDALSVQILSFPDGKRIGILTKFTAQINHLTLDSTLKFLVAGSEDMSVQVISLSDCQVIQRISDIEGPVLSVSLSPGGKYVSASSGDGALKIWSVKEKNLVKEYNCVPFVNNFNSATVYCRANFEPISGRYFAYPDNLEVIVIDTTNWTKKYTFTESTAKGAFSIVEFSPNGEYLAASTIKGCMCVWNLPSQTLVGCSPHPNKNDICSFAWNPSGNGEIVYCDITGELGAIEGCSTLTNSSNIVESAKKVEDMPNNTSDPINFDMSDEEDDENIISLEKIKSGATNLDIFSEDCNAASSRAPSRTDGDSVTELPLSVKSKLQAPFQPSSTPSHLNERYLLWNDIGVVRAFAADETNPAFIDITFHDVSVHHLMHLRNNKDHSMAGLSTKIVVLASERILIGIVLNGNKEWQMEMPDDEDILCVTASETHVAILTDKRMLRIFTIYGTQRDVICVPGPVVSIASKNNAFLVAYHNCAGISDDQNITLMVIHIKGVYLKSIEMRLPLSPASTLSWIGFTNLGSPAIYDSEGLLRLFSPRSSLWHPVFNYSLKRKGVSDGLFIISVNEENEFINAIACKGSCYPPITPKPIVSEFLFTLPLCESHTEKSRLEDIFIRSIHSSLNRNQTILETAIQLFSLGCHESMENRSFEFAEMLTDIPKFVDIAWKYAATKSYTTLADKLTNLMERMQEEPETEESEMISEICESRNNLLNALPVERVPTKNDINQQILRPLPVKQDTNNRIVTCKSPDSQMKLTASAMEDTPPSLETIAERTSKLSKNPFSKSGKAPFRKHPNPFNVSGAGPNNENVEKKEVARRPFGFLSDHSSSLAKKRKEPESVSDSSNTTKRQSKLAQFEFQKKDD